MTRLLFVCTRNKLRSPTVEQVFGGREGLDVASAGTNRDAGTPLTAELVAWADIVFVMEKAQREKLQARYKAVRRTSAWCASTYRIASASWIQRWCSCWSERCGRSCAEAGRL